MDVKLQRDKLNLDFLKKQDPDVMSLTASATHVCLYILDPAKGNQFSKETVEGPCFLAKRSTLPYYRLYLMNRNNPENFSQDISGDKSLDFELGGHFIYIKRQSGICVGLWFYSEEGAISMYTAIMKLIDSNVRAHKGRLRYTPTKGKQRPLPQRTPTQDRKVVNDNSTPNKTQQHGNNNNVNVTHNNIPASAQKKKKPSKFDKFCTQSQALVQDRSVLNQIYGKYSAWRKVPGNENKTLTQFYAR